MIITKDSPFRHLPAALDRRQTIFLDGIRYSVEIGELAYRRLVAVLLEASNERDQMEEGVSLTYVSALLDAWCVVDSIYRLRGLLNHVPRHKKSDTPYKSFVRKTQAADEMRNIVQHLDTEIPKLERLNISAWGALSWGFVVDPKNGVINSCTFIPGTMLPEKGYQYLNPLGKEFHENIDQITLFAGACSMNLSECMRAVEKYISGLNNSLLTQTNGTTPGVRDVVTVATFETGALEAKPKSLA
jgi:hypothetical protein